MTKLKLILLLVISLASKLTAANEGLFQSELQTPQLIPLVNKLNLKETTLFQGSAHLNANNNVLQFENAAVKDKFQKEQAKLMSFKKPTATNVNSKLEVARRLNNSLRMNRLQMIENMQELGVPKMMVSYLRSKNRNELSKLSKANLLPTESHSNVKIAEVPSFLKVNNHQRLLHKLEDDNDSQISVKKNENARTLSGNNRDKKYFQSIEYTTNRLNNTLRNYRLNLAKGSQSDLNDVPTVLAMYIKKKIENERSQLVNRGIIPESYEEAVTEAPSLRPTPRGPVAVNKPKGRAQIVHEDEDEEEEEEEEEEEYEVATTKKSSSKPNFLVVIDEKKASKQRGLKKPKVKAPEPEYETYEYDVKPKKRLQANKSNNKVSNNPNRSNQVRANRPKPEPVVQLDEYYYDEEEVTTTTQAPTTTTTTKAAPRRRYNPRGNQNARASQPRRRVKPVEEPAYEEEEEEETTTRQSKLNQGYKHKTFRRRTTVAPETTSVSVVPEATTQTIVEETISTTTEATTTVAPTVTEPVVEMPIETTTIAPVEESTTTEQVLVEETTTTAVPVDTTTQAVVQDINNKNLKAKRKFKQRVIVDKTSSSQSTDQERPRINANAARQRITPTPAPVRQQSPNPARQRVNPQRLNRQNDITQLRVSPGQGQRFNNAFNRNRLAPQYSDY